MTDLSIGLSGLTAAQRAIELIGANIANASTDGYHRQDGVLTPVSGGEQSLSASGGVAMTDVKRVVDQVVERQILMQQSNLGQVSGSLSALQQMEAAFGATGSEGLATAMSDFFGAINELSASPDSSALQRQVLSSADTMTQEFHSLSQTLDNIENSVRRQASDLTDQVNTLTDKIASFDEQLNGDISNQSALNVLTDQRDQAVSDLSKLLSVQISDFSDTQGDQQTVQAGGMTLVNSSQSNALECGIDADGKLGLSIEGDDLYNSNIQGGQLGAAMELINNILPELRQQLDSLAAAVAGGINQLHVQGVGQDGSFTELESSKQSGGTLDSWGDGITKGSFRIRVIDSDGKATCSDVDIDPAGDTLAGVAASLGQVADISASVTDGRLTITAANGYKFDFLPALAPDPTDAHIIGDARVSVQGRYDGQEDQTYAVTVSGSGQVGVADGLSLEVRDGSGNLVKQVNVGKGYAAGDPIEIADSVSLSIGNGDFNNGDNFSVKALASSDRTGFLAAAGLNVFFTGDSAADIAVNEDLVSDPRSIAVNIGQSMTDAGNLARMAAVGDTALESLGNLSPTDYFGQIVTDVGQEVATRQAKQTSIDQITQQLTTQRDSTSGVDVNEQSAMLLEFQRLYQAMAKYVSVQDSATQYLLSIM